MIVAVNRQSHTTQSGGSRTAPKGKLSSIPFSKPTDTPVSLLPRLWPTLYKKMRLIALQFSRLYPRGLSFENSFENIVSYILYDFLHIICIGLWFAFLVRQCGNRLVMANPLHLSSGGRFGSLSLCSIRYHNVHPPACNNINQNEPNIFY